MSDSVLIVDDSLTVRMDLREAFEDAGFGVQLCATAAAARAAFARGAADVVVLDVLLPDGDGVQLLGELRAAPGAAQAVVLMLSSEAEVKDRLRGLRTGADEYVGKPYDIHFVVAKARELLRARRAQAVRQGPTVLVIDDSRTFREALRTRWSLPAIRCWWRRAARRACASPRPSGPTRSSSTACCRASTGRR